MPWHKPGRTPPVLSATWREPTRRRDRPQLFSRGLGPCGLASGSPELAAFVESPHIAEDLFEEGQFPARRRGRARHRLDIPTVLQILAIDARHDPVAIEPDDIDLLIQHVGAEERELLGLAADVEPVLLVKHTGARRSPQDLDDLVARRRPGMNFGELIGLGKIAALVHGTAASGDGHDGQGQCRQAGEALPSAGVASNRFG